MSLSWSQRFSSRWDALDNRVSRSDLCRRTALPLGDAKSVNAQIEME
jgi:hypothetical protein